MQNKNATAEEILIIGAGPAGLAAAIELANHGKDFTLIEKQSRVGGLAKTYEFKEGDLVFRTDNGPHRFFSKNQKLYDFLEGLLKEHWIPVNRQTRQFIDGKFYDYPINASQALKNIGVWKATGMLAGYGWAKIKYGLFRAPIRNFADYVYANFGKPLGEFNMINYTEKIWGIPAREIHVDWAVQRIKGLNIFALVKNSLSSMFGMKTAKPKSLVDVFYYPDNGTGEIYETILSKLRSQDKKIFLDTKPVKIFHKDKKITRVEYISPSGKMDMDVDILIESIPLKAFLSLLDPAPPAEILAAQKKLRYRQQVYLFITLDKDTVTPDQWIYFPEKDVPIGRMSEMKNFSARMSPVGKTSLFLEFFCFDTDPVYSMSEKELFEYALPYLEKMGFATRKEVRKYYRLFETDVYPIYDIAYKEYLSVIKGYLDQFENLYYIGRPGRFRYNNQDHSLEMGFLAAQSVIDGVRYDLEKVGDEQEYFEKGTVPPKNT